MPKVVSWPDQVSTQKAEKPNEQTNKPQLRYSDKMATAGGLVSTLFRG